MSTDLPALFAGQRLTAADLTAVQRREQDLRELHNRTLHMWGVAQGLRVTGERGARTVLVQPGYAVDSAGHDLVLADGAEMAVPPVAGVPGGGPATYHLTLSHPDGAGSASGFRPGVCGTTGPARDDRTPVLRWQFPDPARGYRHGLDVVLATAPVRDCVLAADPSSSARRDALPTGQPYVASGSSLEGATAWRWWPDAVHPIGVVATVTTAEAAFRGTPRYQGSVVGERAFFGTVLDTRRSFVLDGYTSIASASAASFDLCVALPTGAAFGSSGTDAFAVADFNAAVSIWSVPEYALRWNGPTLCLGDVRVAHTVPGDPTAGGGTHTINADDLRRGLTSFATRNGQSLDAVVAANSIDLSPGSRACLTIGQTLATGPSALPLNPADLLGAPELLSELTATLRWYVQWIGVEA